MEEMVRDYFEKLDVEGPATEHAEVSGVLFLYSYKSHLKDLD